MAVSSFKGGTQVYDLNTKKQLLSKKWACNAINLKGSLLAMAFRCGDIALYDVDLKQKLMYFEPRSRAYSIGISSDGTMLAAGLEGRAGECMANLFRKHENCTLEQVQLKCAMLKWLQLEKPDKSILEGAEISGILEKLFADISTKCDLDYENECVNVWLTFHPKMQRALLETFKERINTYGK